MIPIMSCVKYQGSGIKYRTDEGGKSVRESSPGESTLYISLTRVVTSSMLVSAHSWESSSPLSIIRSKQLSGIAVMCRASITASVYMVVMVMAMGIMSDKYTDRDRRDAVCVCRLDHRYGMGSSRDGSDTV